MNYYNCLGLQCNQIICYPYWLSTTVVHIVFDPSSTVKGFSIYYFYFRQKETVLCSDRCHMIINILYLRKIYFAVMSNCVREISR